MFIRNKLEVHGVTLYDPTPERVIQLVRDMYREPLFHININSSNSYLNIQRVNEQRFHVRFIYYQDGKMMRSGIVIDSLFTEKDGLIEHEGDVEVEEIELYQTIQLDEVIKIATYFIQHDLLPDEVNWIGKNFPNE